MSKNKLFDLRVFLQIDDVIMTSYPKKSLNCMVKKAMKHPSCDPLLEIILSKEQCQVLMNGNLSRQIIL